MQGLLILFALLWMIAAAMLLLWHSWRFINLSHVQKQGAKPTPEKDLSISLIICFKNEERNLVRCLPHWLEQDYANFEIILVDDFSGDSSALRIRNFQNENSKLRLISPSPNDISGKKHAQARGIRAAENEYLVFTDADCIPSSPKHLSHMASHLANHDLILGYGALQGSGFVGSLSEYETVQTALRYWSYALKGNAYMGVGRNMAYRKTALHPEKALARHSDLLSGDDDLTIREMAKGLRVACLFDSEAFTISPAAPNFRAWLHQKGRHYSTAWRYEQKVKIALGTEGLLQLAFAVLFPLSLFVYPVLTLSLFLGRWLLTPYPSKYHKPLLTNSKVARLWPFLEMIWAIATALLHLRNLVFGPPKKW